MTLLKVPWIIWVVVALNQAAIAVFLVVSGQAGSIIKIQILPLCCVWLFFAAIRLFATVEPKGGSLRLLQRSGTNSGQGRDRGRQ